MAENVSLCAHIVRLCVGNESSEETSSEQESSSKTSTDEGPQINFNIENVTVKLRISDTQIIAQVYSNQLSIADIKKDIADKFEVSAEILCLEQCGQILCNECLLGDTEADDFGIREFTVSLIHPEPQKEYVDEEEEDEEAKVVILPTLDLNIYYSKCRLPDFLTVHIIDEDTKESKNLVVEIKNEAIVKPFLCGYKDRDTGIEYLDAYTQTGPYFDKWKLRRYYSRDTQTAVLKEKLVDTTHDEASQCFLDGNNVLFLSDCTNIVISPKKYQTHAQKVKLENKLGKIRLIQRNWRRFLAVRYMKNAAAEYRRLVANRLAEEEAFKQELVQRGLDEERAKKCPRTKDDFDLLYSEVHRWKQAQVKRIVSLYEGGARIAEMSILLDKEIQLLNSIERRRSSVFQTRQAAQREQELIDLGKPIKWIGYKDHIIHLDLKRTQRVRFLHEIYMDLKKPLEKFERLTLLRKIKYILVNEQEFPDFPKLCDLVEREINLLIYTKQCDIEVLRERIVESFRELIKFRKEGTREKVARRMCSVCHKVKRYEAFALWTRQNNVDVCKTCHDLVVTSTENTVYNAVLRSIQREEQKKRCSSSYAFVLQVDDIRYILESIWHSHSILSKNGKLESLRLPRWIKGDDWSPWNCVCLTEWEARDHYQIQDLEAFYDRKIILEIGNRHKLARAAFHKLAAVTTEFLETGEWWDAGMNQQRTAKLGPLVKMSK